MAAQRILVVDDEPDVTAYLKDYFQKQGFDVFTASSGEEGLNTLLSEKPALVLLDLRLGDSFSGLEVLRRAILAKAKSEIIVVTAVDDHNVATMAMGLGAADYITKPFVVEDLERVVLARLKRASS